MVPSPSERPMSMRVKAGGGVPLTPTKVILQGMRSPLRPSRTSKASSPSGPRRPGGERTGGALSGAGAASAATSSSGPRRRLIIKRGSRYGSSSAPVCSGAEEGAPCRGVAPLLVLVVIRSVRSVRRRPEQRRHQVSDLAGELAVPFHHPVLAAVVAVGLPLA